MRAQMRSGLWQRRDGEVVASQRWSRPVGVVDLRLVERVGGDGEEVELKKFLDESRIWEGDIDGGNAAVETVRRGTQCGMR